MGVLDGGRGSGQGKRGVGWMGVEKGVLEEKGILRREKGSPTYLKCQQMY